MLYCGYFLLFITIHNIGSTSRDLRVPSRTRHAVHLETSCFKMTARKQCFLTIYVLHRHHGYCFGCFSSSFLLFVTFGPTSPASHAIYTVSGHSHTLDMAIHVHENSIRDSRLGRDVTSIVAALHASWHVARRSARGMCSMNTSSLLNVFGLYQTEWVIAVLTEVRVRLV